MNTPPAGLRSLRSAHWFADSGKNGLIARHHMRQIGLDATDLARPVVGIASTWSELTPCNAHLRLLADHVRRGVIGAGGTPVEFGVMSLGEPLMRPTTMLYRNQAAMEAEELIRANPLDAVVLLGGCDKTLPALLMGAASANVPAIALSGGPMLNGRFRGRPVGSGTDIWRMTEDVRAGRATPDDLDEFEGCLARSAGHCMTMGTASTMSAITEALGMQLPRGADLPAVDARRHRLAAQTGSRAVALALNGIRPSDIMTTQALRNAIAVNAAIGGSTNAILHLLALAGRLGLPVDLDDIDRIGREIPLLVDLMPSGQFLMEEFSAAGGVPVLLREMGGLVDIAAVTVSGQSIGDIAAAARNDDPMVIRPLSDPVQSAGGSTAVLRGSLAPDGAVIKVSAANPQLLVHRGSALVFDSLEDYLAVIDDADLPCTDQTVLVVRNVGPRGYPGMPEVGNLPMPKVLLDKGIDDMVRISDARMSGTAYGTVILHVAPEAAIGGPLALVRTGDEIVLDVAARRLDVVVDSAELANRAAAWQPPQADGTERGWVALYRSHVLQADRGVDLDFLVGSTPSDHPAKAF